MRKRGRECASTLSFLLGYLLCLNEGPQVGKHRQLFQVGEAAGNPHIQVQPAQQKPQDFGCLGLDFVLINVIGLYIVEELHCGFIIVDKPLQQNVFVCLSLQLQDGLLGLGGDVRVQFKFADFHRYISLKKIR